MNIANKYRPKSFDDIVAQQAVTDILRQQLATNSIKNTYIFSGASGTGKTTTARIFAHELNKYQDAAGNWCSSDPIEIDAASNNGVDSMRLLIQNASTRSLDGKYKVIILDEAHMLTTQSWNALLKTIEEPPRYTIFIFCTTEDHKIPDTIKNRCMRFKFTRISSELIEQRLAQVCEKEGFINYTESCDYISRVCNGELRNALSLLETCADYSRDLTINNVIYSIGDFSYDIYFELINNIIDGSSMNVFKLIDSLYSKGNDLCKFIENFLDFTLDILKYILSNDIKCTKIPASFEDKLKFAIGFDNASRYYFYYVDKLLELKSALKVDPNPKLTIDVIFSQMSRLC